MSGADHGLGGNETTFKDAVALAATLETLVSEVREVNKESTRIYYNRSSAQKTCHKCGREGHRPTECRFYGAICHACGKKGHIHAACRGRKEKAPAAQEPWKQTPARATVKRIDGPKEEGRGGDTESASSSDDIPGCFQLQVNSVKAAPPTIEVTVKMNGQPIRLDLDTEVAVMIVSEQAYNKCLRHVPLNTADVEL